MDTAARHKQRRPSNLPQTFEQLSRGFRQRRMRQFLNSCGVTPQTLVLDAGGNAKIWSLVPAAEQPRIVFLNLPRAFEPDDDPARTVFGDGLRLPFADGAFDLVFSNSVIEHVGPAARQRQFANEIRRVGKRYWVQTPNRRFPVEQHLLTPFLHWLPPALRAAAARRFTVWQWIAKPDAARREFYVEHFLRDIHLLDRAQIQDLFPEAAIHAERWGPFVKSWVACKL